MGSAAARSAGASGVRSTGHVGECVSARRIHSAQKVCAHVRVVVGSVKGARQMQQIYVSLSVRKAASWKQTH